MDVLTSIKGRAFVVVMEPLFLNAKLLDVIQTHNLKVCVVNMDHRWQCALLMGVNRKLRRLVFVVDMALLSLNANFRAVKK
jgi:hypothetical protein